MFSWLFNNRSELQSPLEEPLQTLKIVIDTMDNPENNKTSSTEQANVAHVENIQSGSTQPVTTTTESSVTESVTNAVQSVSETVQTINDTVQTVAQAVTLSLKTDNVDEILKSLPIENFTNSLNDILQSIPPLAPTLSELRAVVKRPLTPVQENTEEVREAISTPVHLSLLDRCNDKWLLPRSWRLERHSSICYRLRNAVKNETFLFYIKPISQITEVVYELGIKEVYFPHIQTIEKFNQRMADHQVPVSFVDKNTVQIGKESLSLYLCVKETEIKEFHYLIDTK